MGNTICCPTSRLPKLHVGLKDPKNSKSQGLAENLDNATSHTSVCDSNLIELSVSNWNLTRSTENKYL
ncbi:unnamed protein product [Moneuplotes crassus]|uniref:Uncharacterized protein n=1 Tax=Euplotes crassus TaxID=5936 RepID=A0AAD2CZ98_EUPCR|nr:unnamed protein product [Moneuplotes crassus]